MTKAAATQTITGLAISFLLISASAAEGDTVCVGCHGAQTGTLSKPVEEWHGSIHAANRISCHNCHGGDPADAANAMDPARGFIGAPKEDAIPKFCGRCHIGVLKDFLKSPHGKRVGKGGPTCVTCHESHKIAKVVLEIINEKRCSSCHSYDRASRIKKALQPTEIRLVQLETELAAHKNRGFDVDQLLKTLFSVRNRYHSLSHELDVEKVQKESELNRSELEKVDRVVDEIHNEQSKRKVFGIFVVSGAFLAALLFHLLRKTYR